MNNKKILITIAIFIAFVVNSFGSGSGLSITNLSQNSSPSSFAISWTVLTNFEQLELVQSYNVFSVNSNGNRTNLGSIKSTNANTNFNNYTLNITLLPCSSYNLQVEAIGGGGEDANTQQGVTNVYAFTTSDYDRSQVSILQFNLNYSTSGAPQNFNWIANQIKLNPGFSFSPSGSNFVQFTGTNIYTCSTITNRSDSLPQKLILNESINNSSTPNISNLQIYPNPTNDKITIDIPNVAANTTVSIINFVGQTIYSAAIITSTTIVDLSTYNSGVYLVKINSAEISKAIKLIKN